jgi:hypothetical protein
MKLLINNGSSTQVIESGDTVMNKHGVECIIETTGRYGHLENDRWVCNLPVYVPLVCLDCHFFDRGEVGDYGSKLSPPYCKRNVLSFPTRKGTCAIKENYKKEKEMTEVVCKNEECKKIFKVSFYKRNTAMYCSRKCHHN